LAKDYLNADPDEVVLVTNATTSVYSIIQSIIWEKGDKILYYSTIYGACEKILFQLADSRGVELVKVDLIYPIEHEQLIEKTLDTISKCNSYGRPIKLALFDAITSNPGVIVPWERLVKVFREHNILSLVDAAHAIGQIPIDIRSADPDFFVSNVHKWAFGHRGCCVLYVPKRNHHLAHSVPVSHAYVSTDPSRAGSSVLHFYSPNDFVNEWSWTGTMEFGSFLSIGVALDFREWLGGEKKINEYCHNLAREGGKILAKILGTEVIEAKDSQLTASMVNVWLPFETPVPKSDTPQGLAKVSSSQISQFNSLFFKHNMFVAVYKHNNKWAVRASAQVYNELVDFEKAGNVLKKICDNPHLLTEADKTSNPNQFDESASHNKESGI